MSYIFVYFSDLTNEKSKSLKNNICVPSSSVLILLELPGAAVEVCVPNVPKAVGAEVAGVPKLVPKPVAAVEAGAPNVEPNELKPVEADVAGVVPPNAKALPNPADIKKKTVKYSSFDC